MKPTIKKKCHKCVVSKRRAGCLFGCTRTERVLRELDVMMRDSAREPSAIEEQLRRCPEAFQAGELVGKLFDAHKYGRDEGTKNDRHFPPAGAVVPPLV